MSIYQIFMKLMSRHLLSHLIAPLILGVVMETGIAWGRAWYHGAPISILDYLISWERLGLYAGVFASYLGIAAYFVNKEAVDPWQKTETLKLDRTLQDATNFFATCTIPLKDWFEPYTQQYFSHLVKGQLTGAKFNQERVLLFFKDSALSNAKTQYLDGLYAKPLAEIHRNYGITLGFLTQLEIEEILSHYACPNLDFAFVTHSNPPYETVLLFEKEGHHVKLTRISEADKIEPYKKLVKAIKDKIFVHGTNQLNDENDFYAAVH